MPSPSMLIYLRRLQITASWLIISIGLVTLVGWVTDFSWATGGLLNLAAQKATTASGLVIAGAALALWGENPTPRRRRLAQVAGSIAALVGLLTLAEYLLSWPMDIDTLLAPEQSSAYIISYPGRMSINSALCLLLTGAALVTLELRIGRQYLAEWLALGAGFILLTVYIGFIYQLENLSYRVGFTGMASHTAVAFSALCIGILVARPQRGIMAHFWSDAPAGIVARSMSFGGITLLMLLSWLTEQGWRRSLYGERYQVALLLALGALVFALLVHRSIRALVRLDHERQQGVTELQASETRFRQLIEQAADGIFIADIQGRYRRVNASGAAMLGYTPNELMGKAFTDLVPTTDQPRLADLHQQLLQPNQKHFGEWQLQRKNGTYLPVEINAQILPDGRWLAIIRDITERKAIAAQLATHARQQAVVAQLGQEALREEDLQRFMNAVTHAVADTLAVDFCKLSELLPDRNQLLLRAGSGWRPGLVGKAVLGTEIESQSGYTLLTSEPVIVTNLQHERRFTASDILAEHHVVSGVSCIIGDPHDHPFGVLGVHTLAERHFTTDEVNFLQTVANLVAYAVQRKEAEVALRQLNATLEERVAERTAELERSNYELDQFAYVASHDLKAPLRAIDNLASWLAEDVGDTLPPDSREHLSKLRLRVQRMEHLLEDLLTYSRVGRRDHVQEEINVNSLLQDTVDLLAPPPGFTVTVASSIPVIHTPRAPLELVFRNLINNAIKHHNDPAQGQLEIRFHNCGDYLTFMVTDNGPGIDPKFHERVFGMFQTLRPRDDVEGSGMGLAVVKKVVEHWGGSISIASVPGQGATFTFTWPKDIVHQSRMSKDDDDA